MHRAAARGNARGEPRYSPCTPPRVSEGRREAVTQKTQKVTPTALSGAGAAAPVPGVTTACPGREGLSWLQPSDIARAELAGPIMTYTETHILLLFCDLQRCQQQDLILTALPARTV